MGGRRAGHVWGAGTPARQGQERTFNGPACFHIGHSVERGAASVVVAGELDLASSPELEMQVDALLAQGARNLVFDCHDVSFIDSSALRVIVGAELKVGEDGGTVTIARPSDTMRGIMEVAGSPT